MYRVEKAIEATIKANPYINMIEDGIEKAAESGAREITVELETDVDHLTLTAILRYEGYTVIPNIMMDTKKLTISWLK